MKILNHPPSEHNNQTRWRPGTPIPEGHTERAWRALQAHAEFFEREQERQRFSQSRRAYRGDRRAA
jgi:hypothetical protein